MAVAVGRFKPHRPCDFRPKFGNLALEANEIIPYLGRDGLAVFF